MRPYRAMEAVGVWMFRVAGIDKLVMRLQMRLRSFRRFHERRTVRPAPNHFSRQLGRGASLGRSFPGYVGPKFGDILMQLPEHQKGAVPTEPMAGGIGGAFRHL